MSDSNIDLYPKGLPKLAQYKVKLDEHNSGVVNAYINKLIQNKEKYEGTELLLSTNSITPREEVEEFSIHDIKIDDYNYCLTRYKMEKGRIQFPFEKGIITIDKLQGNKPITTRYEVLLYTETYAYSNISFDHLDRFILYIINLRENCGRELYIKNRTYDREDRWDNSIKVTKRDFNTIYIPDKMKVEIQNDATNAQKRENRKLFLSSKCIFIFFL